MRDIPEHIRIHPDETTRIVRLLVDVGSAVCGNEKSEAAATVQQSNLKAARIVATLAHETTTLASALHAQALEQESPKQQMPKQEKGTPKTHKAHRSSPSSSTPVCK